MNTIINAIPYMDEGGLAFFKKALTDSQCYLEYGSGGSTVYACNVAQVKVIISVELDKLWFEKVKASLENAKSSLLIEHCDLGEVGDWSVPKSKDRVNDFWKYMVTPWGSVQKSVSYLKL